MGNQPFIKLLSILLIGFCGLKLSYSSKIGDVSPLYLYGVAGQDIHILCWFNPKEFPSCKDSKNLTFFNETSDKEVPENDITIVNRTTIRYTLRNTDVMEMKYICKCKYDEGAYSAIEISSIKIGTQPQPVTNFNCYSYNFEYFYCSFTAPYNPLFVTYLLEFTVYEYYKPWVNGTKLLLKISQEYFKICNLATQMIPNSLNTIYYCNMTTENNLYSRIHEMYSFRLQASNHYGSKNQTFQINHFDSVIPAKPELYLLNSTSNSLTFQWQNNLWDLFYKRKGFEYNLKYLPETGKTEKKDEDFIQYNLTSSIDKNTSNGTTKFVIVLKDLEYAYTWYDIRLNIKVRTSKKDGTMWSEQFNGTYRTGARSPDSPPKTDKGSFYMDSKALHLYWEKLPTYKENGANIRYEIASTKRNGIESPNLEPICNYTSISAVCKLLTNDRFELTIKAVNNVSASAEGSTIIIPQQTDKFKESFLPQRFSKIFHNNSYELSWEPPKVSTNLYDYTIFWCKPKVEKLTECDDSIHFEHVNRSNHNITRMKGEHLLNFAVSANYNNFSSGMVWALCTASKDFPEMEITLSAQRQTILIAWILGCEYRSLIEGYYLTYCPFVGSADKPNCTEPEKQVKIPKNLDDRYELKNLKPYTSYMINIRMYSNTIEGPNMSQSKYTTTLELRPSEPRNLRLVNVTSNYAVIEWTVPEHKNGEIRYYEILYDNKQIRLDNNNFSDNDTTIMYRMESLKSFYNYKVYVIAMTVDRSDPSNDVAFRTWMGQPDSVSLNHPKDTFNGRLISWARPQEPAGNTSFYEVIVSAKDRQQNPIKELTVRSRVLGTNCTLINLCPADMASIGYLIISVSAVNAIENDKYDVDAFGEPRPFEQDDDSQTLSNRRRRKRSSTNFETESDMGKNYHQNKEYLLQEDHQYYNNIRSLDEDKQDEIMYNRNDYKCLEHIPYERIVQKYNNHVFFPGPLTPVRNTQCTYNANSNVQQLRKNIICALSAGVVIVFLAAFVFISFKKIKKMKNIDFVLPPGLADLNQDINHQKGISADNTELTKNPSLESLDKNEKHRLLTSSGNDSGFLPGHDYLSENDINSSTDRINEDDRSSTRSDSIEMSDMSNDSNHSSPSQSPNVNLRSDRIFNESSTPSAAQSLSKPLIINGYVQHSAIQQPSPPPAIGYTTLEAIAKPTTMNFDLTPDSPTTTSNKSKQESISSPETPVSNQQNICGYVTHKQLSEFGQQSIQ